MAYIKNSNLILFTMRFGLYFKIFNLFVNIIYANNKNVNKTVFIFKILIKPNGFLDQT